MHYVTLRNHLGSSVTRQILICSLAPSWWLMRGGPQPSLAPPAKIVKVTETELAIFVRVAALRAASAGASAVAAAGAVAAASGDSGNGVALAANRAAAQFAFAPRRCRRGKRSNGRCTNGASSSGNTVCTSASTTVTPWFAQVDLVLAITVTVMEDMEALMKPLHFVSSSWRLRSSRLQPRRATSSSLATL